MISTFPPLPEIAGPHLSVYEAWYNHVDVQKTNCIGAADAAVFLKKSSLPDSVLGQIWSIADPRGTGALDKAGLFVALKMIALAQNNKPVDVCNARLNVQPPNMGSAPPVPPPPAPSSGGIWNITATERQRYTQVFMSLKPQADKLSGVQVREVLMNSKLPNDTLGRIWDLSDLDKDGQLDLKEFTIAMHLVYRVIEKNPLPELVPPELLSSAAPRSNSSVTPPVVPPPPDAAALQSVVSGPRWVVSSGDKARYDVMFRAADLDRDGFVNGGEIKDSFLKSGLPQLVLAHLWSLCDMQQTGKLNTEQFALAMYLLERRVRGVELPAQLSEDMIPPTMRPKPLIGGAAVVQKPVQAEPCYDNPELQAIYKEVQAMMESQAELQTEISQKEGQLQGHNSEASTLQRELDTLSSTLKQLEGQKVAAQGKLDDLSNQVTKLRSQVSDQESTVLAEEKELQERRQELNKLREEEKQLDKSLNNSTRRQQRLSRVQEDLALQLSQAKSKTAVLEECEKEINVHLAECRTVLDSNDPSLATNTMFTIDDSPFTDPAFLRIQSNLSPEAITPSSPPSAPLSLAVTPEKSQPPPRPASPFSQSVTQAPVSTVDPFAAWDRPAFSVGDSAPEPAPAASQSDSDAFEADPFAALRPPSRNAVESQKKKPPPRPCPPKNPPARPPPPSIARKSTPVQSNDTENFANFADFDQMTVSSSSVAVDPWDPFGNTSSSTPTSTPSSNLLASSSSPWGAPEVPQDPLVATISDPFTRFDPFENSKLAASSGILSSPDSGVDPFSSSDPFSSTDPFSCSDPFPGSPDPFSNSSDLLSSSSDPFTRCADPFAGSVDPFSKPVTSSVANGSLSSTPVPAIRLSKQT